MREQYAIDAPPQYQPDFWTPNPNFISQKKKSINFRAVEQWVFKQLSELSLALTYHGKHHTSGVLVVAKYLCVLEKISESDTLLVKTAALFHDIGFLFTYQNHEAKGCEVAREALPDFGYDKQQIEKICEMIMATKVPQSPQCILAQIVCDADLDYLGRDDYEEVSQSLVKEWKTFNAMPNLNDWTNIQIKFLESHRFYTLSSQKMRNKTKEKRIQQLKQIGLNP